MLVSLFRTVSLPSEHATATAALDANKQRRATAGRPMASGLVAHTICRDDGSKRPANHALCIYRRISSDQAVMARDLQHAS